MNPRKLLASTAICGVLLAGCTSTPTEGQKAAREAAQPSVTVIQPTTVTKTCEGTCQNSPSTTRHTSGPTKPATAPAPSAGGPTEPGTPGRAGASAQTAVAPSPAYSRDQFGSGWADPDGNGCDGRQDAVARATTDQHRTSRCYIATGDVTDWYTGKVCDDCATRNFDVDHVVALADAWRSGADKWTRTKRIRYANDPLVLVITNASLNRSKSDRGPDEWAPINHAAACKYVRRYRQIKLAWGLHSTPAQRAAIRRTLATC
jgi:hypothetical protein